MRAALMAFAVALAAAPAVAGVHSAEVEARLQRIVGDWTLQGQEASYRENCLWYRDRAFVVCSTEDTSDASKSESILGYSKTEGRFTYHNYGNRGGSRSEIGFPWGEQGLVFWGEHRTASGIVRTQTYLEPLADGRIRFRQDRAINGGDWLRGDDGFYVPRTPPAKR